MATWSRNYDQLALFQRPALSGRLLAEHRQSPHCGLVHPTVSLERITASYDLNCDQLEALLRTAPPEWFEVTIHQHMPLFHMEHCVFAPAYPGNGLHELRSSLRKARVQLRDRVGAAHPVKVDAGCRNTVSMPEPKPAPSMSND